MGDAQEVHLEKLHTETRLSWTEARGLAWNGAVGYGSLNYLLSTVATMGPSNMPDSAYVIVFS